MLATRVPPVAGLARRDLRRSSCSASSRSRPAGCSRCCRTTLVQWVVAALFLVGAVDPVPVAPGSNAATERPTRPAPATGARRLPGGRGELPGAVRRRVGRSVAAADGRSGRAGATIRTRCFVGSWLGLVVVSGARCAARPRAAASRSGCRSCSYVAAGSLRRARGGHGDHRSDVAVRPVSVNGRRPRRPTAHDVAISLLG